MDFLPYTHEYILAVSIMSGMILGFIWDLYRLFRHYFKPGVIQTAIGDILYWIVSIYISTKIIFEISLGNIRFFILIGFLFGAILYFYFVSNQVLKLFIKIIDYIIRTVKRIVAFMVYPVKFVLKKIKMFLYPIKLKIVKERNNLKRKYKFFKFRLKKSSKNRKMLYNKKKRLKQQKKRLGESNLGRKTKGSKVKKKK